MRPLYRYAIDASSCPASGNVVGLDDDEGTEARCSVCGRPLRLAPRRDGAGRRVARVASHRPLQASAPKGREAERLRAQAHRAELRARELAAKTKHGRAVERALQRAVDALRAWGTSAAVRRAAALERRLVRVQLEGERRTAPQLPGSPGAIVAEMVRTSGVDLGTVEPDGWLEHVGQALSRTSLGRVRRAPVRAQVRVGLVELVRAARPRSWADLETGRRVVGQYGALPWAREFRGLSRLDIPQAARDAAIRIAELEHYAAQEVPF